MKDGKKLIVDPLHAPIVREIFEMVANGMSVVGVCKELRRRGIPTKAETRKNVPAPKCVWHTSTIMNTLVNLVYTGDMASQRTWSTIIGKRRQTDRPPEEWVVVAGTHEAIVSKELFSAVQESLGSRKLFLKREESTLFAGVLFCADCGHSLSRHHNDYPRYTCSTHENPLYVGKERPCSPHLIREELLTAAVLENINKHIASFKPDNYVRDPKETQRLKSLLEEREYREEELKLMLRRVLEKYAKGILDEAIYEELTQSYQLERQENMKVLQYARIELATNYVERARQFSLLLKQYEPLEELTRSVVLDLIDRIMVHESPFPKNEWMNRSQLIEIHYKHIGMLGGSVTVQRNGRLIRK